MKEKNFFLLLPFFVITGAVAAGVVFFVSGAADADMVLKGELVDFRKDPLRYDNGDNVLEYRVSIVVNLSMWDKKANTLIWQENNFTGDTTYYVSGATSISEAAAVNNALTDLARRVVERAVEQW